MKKFKINVVMIAIIVGTIAAFAFKAPSHKVSNGTSYYWFDASGVYTGDFDDETTQLGKTPCDNTTSILCEGGYISSQLKNPANPSAGVLSGQTPMAQINEKQE